MDGLKAFFGFGRIPANEDNLSSGAGIPFGDGTTKLARPADDDCGLILEGEEFEDGRHDENEKVALLS